jgi:hypothetical protein
VNGILGRHFIDIINWFLQALIGEAKNALLQQQDRFIVFFD